MKRGGSLSGAVSLVMIFCVLCLAVFAVLTMATADRERRLAELTADRAAEYYAADAEATKIVAALVRGETPDTAADLVYGRAVAVSAPHELVSFSLPAGGEQELQVEVLLFPDGRYAVRRWATAYVGAWEPNQFIEVWDGN